MLTRIGGTESGTESSSCGVHRAGASTDLIMVAAVQVECETLTEESESLPPPRMLEALDMR